MADLRHDATAPARDGRGGRVFYGWRVVAALAVSQTVGDLGLSLPVATGAVTLTDEFIGRRIKNHRTMN
ncbi:hypothetical protein [Actinocorallia longicatena]|uniref:MFS transporter n=1 Tax=Actinocorallia longicatena TaxID=111803 RepID=A0ABP6QGA8_9ACTN